MAAVLGGVGWWMPALVRLAEENHYILLAKRSPVLDTNYFADLHKALEFEPNDPMVHYLLGENLRKWMVYAGGLEPQKIGAEAEAALHRSLELNPHHAKTWDSLALTANWLDDTNSASQCFNEASQRGPQDVQIAYDHAVFRLRNGDPARAIELARQSTNWVYWGNWQPVQIMVQAQEMLDRAAATTPRH
jgi:hypothetical protein